MKQILRFLFLAAMFDPGCMDLVQNLNVPDFLTRPALIFDGPMFNITFTREPFDVQVVSGDAHVERIDEHTIRLVSSSSNVSIPIEPDEAIYGLTERIVDDRNSSEVFVQEVGGLDRRGEIVTMWVTPTEAVYSPFHISSAGYGMYVEGTNPGTYDIGKTPPSELRLSRNRSSSMEAIGIVPRGRGVM